MPDKRQEKRQHKRLKLVYMEGDEPPKIGFLEDISESGIFIKSVQVLPPNRVLTVEITTSKDEKIVLTGRVMWARKVPINMMRRMKGGMGLHIIKFIEGEELFRSFL